MDFDLYLRLIIMMFLEFAIWGCAPVLASHLIGKLKFSGKETGWIYATLWIACIISPFAGGQIANCWIATEYFLAAAHLLGGVILIIAAKKQKFSKLFGLMLFYSLLYVPTLALVNSLMFTHIKDRQAQSGSIRVWGTIGWMALDKKRFICFAGEQTAVFVKR
jgi:hypothetical protein